MTHLGRLTPPLLLLLVLCAGSLAATNVSSCHIDAPEIYVHDNVLTYDVSTINGSYSACNCESWRNDTMDVS